jgi:hypothetical protein
VVALLVLPLTTARRLEGRTIGSPRSAVDGVRWHVFWAIVPTAVTLAWEWTTGDMTSNIVRACAGAPIGGVAAWIVMRSALPDGQSG